MVRCKIFLFMISFIFIIQISYISSDSYGVVIGSVENTSDAGVKMFSPSSNAGNITNYNNITNNYYVVNQSNNVTNNISNYYNLTDYTNIALLNQTNTGNFSISGWFNGLFSWVIDSITSSNWLSFNGTTLSFNETRMNYTLIAMGIANNWNSTYNATYATYAYNHTIETFNLYNSSWDNRGLINAVNNSINNTWNQSYAEDLYVNVAGDNMTGNLTLTNGAVIKDRTEAGSYIRYTTSGGMILVGRRQ